MRFERASHDHHNIFSEWNQFNRLEERTCRPVIDGKRMPPNAQVVTLSFFLSGADEPVGRFNYFDLNPHNRSAEFGYMVNPKFRRQGIGTKMLTLAIGDLFPTTNLNKLYCQTAAFNIPSIELLEKLEFHRDGVLREHHELDDKL
ncbi:GNAT family N-acetyltransferase [Leptolyngbya sp. FACHB-261]|uniref:GNAT family N-acetyltransferase n=1 Tax=Leptolyngbya sp. FACHB-261 TaxID=2692806 RepID=UPI001686CEF9|nr:GNAT family protein [Leptolyngbya sp. FACHB-261]MBD2101629.1 GNAT family N-acetyltransferase [Leptolyngbya sp. FACHB-261]